MQKEPTITERETDPLRVEFLVGPHAEFGPLVFIDPNPIRTFGGLVVLPGHWDARQGEEKNVAA